MPADPERVAAVLASLTPTPEFASAAKKAALIGIQRLTADARSGELTECSALLTHVRSRLDGLDPKALVAPGGISGLFNGPGKRLRRFRGAFTEVGRAVTDTAAELSERMAAVERRHRVLDQLIEDSRATLAELGAHVAAARQWLNSQPQPDPSEDGSVAADPHAAFRAHVDDLAETVAAGVRQLPLVRALQNTEARTIDRTRKAIEGLHAWQQGWTTGLGLEGRKPRKIRPDALALWRERESASGALASADTYVAESRARRSDVERRLDAAVHR
ncbi:hypothetical protein GVN24_31705 [Rhizobium sp. CRIBSB]|nr:hypothetical protein [Rhizobium sp. CRIBSB]